MYLAQVEIKNFRCLQDLRVDLRQGLNVLVGRNNVGKTSLLAAIRHALGSGSSRGDALWLTEDDFYRAGPGAERVREIEVLLTFRGLSEEQRAYFYEIVDFNHADLAGSPVVVRFRATWNESKGRAVVRRTGGRLVPTPQMYPGRFCRRSRSPSCPPCGMRKSISRQARAADSR